MIEFFSNLNQVLINVNNLIDRLTSDNAPPVKLNIELTVNGVPVDITVSETPAA